MEIVMRDALVIFLDGYPFSEVKCILPPEWSATAHHPHIGYSVNIKAEMFAGLTPDAMGRYCEWNLREARRGWSKDGLIRLASAGRLLGERGDWLAHRMLDRAI